MSVKREEKYDYTVTCSICGHEEVYKSQPSNFFPDGWFELRNNGQPVRVLDDLAEIDEIVPEPAHMCLSCWWRLIYNGGIHKVMPKRVEDVYTRYWNEENAQDR